jgi:methylenetetrahydrofolate reductase (NADPH)
MQAGFQFLPKRNGSAAQSAQQRQAAQKRKQQGFAIQCAKGKKPQDAHIRYNKILSLAPQALRLASALSCCRQTAPAAEHALARYTIRSGIAPSYIDISSYIDIFYNNSFAEEKALQGVKSMNIARRITVSEKPFYSLEFFPPKEEKDWPAFFATVEQLRSIDPLFVSVTYGAGGSTQHNTLALAGKLKEMRLETMTHLTCVGADKAKIAAFLRDLRAGGVENVLALRGDPPQGQHADWGRAVFRYASDLVRFVREQDPLMGLAVAGYPAAHPESATFRADRDHTCEKIRAGADFVITQLFFDVREYEDFVRSLRAQGIRIPVIPGVLPIQSLESVRRILALCGANIPGKLYLELEAAHTRGGAAAVKETGIAFAVHQIRRLLEFGAPGIHLYTLNRASTCLRIVEEAGCAATSRARPCP